MGMSLMSSSYSCFDKSSALEKPPIDISVASDPDPRVFGIERVEEVRDYLIVKVKYPNCKNCEGSKILVFNSLSLRQLNRLSILDPHFSSENPKFSPIARFVPTPQGWAMAVRFASIKEKL